MKTRDLVGRQKECGNALEVPFSVAGLRFPQGSPSILRMRSLAAAMVRGMVLWGRRASSVRRANRSALTPCWSLRS
jgi:hypothetical protein